MHAKDRRQRWETATLAFSSERCSWLASRTSARFRCLPLQRSPEEEDDNWCPPLPARTYLMDAFREELSGFSSKSDELCYAATLVSSPQRDPQRRSESSRLNHFDLLARHQLGSQVSQSDPDLFATKDQDHKIHQWAEDFTREGLSKGQHGPPPMSMSPVFRRDFFPSISRQAASVTCGLISPLRGWRRCALLSGQPLAYASEPNPSAPAHRSRGRKKAPKDVQLRRDLHSQAGSAETFSSLATGRGDLT